MATSAPSGHGGHPGQVFAAFLRLGCTAFGGPVAHIAYFRQAFVVQRGWLDEAAFAELLAFCQFLPGPTSSQLGFLIGWRRAGLAGAIAAFVAFTAPAALMLTVLALALAHSAMAGAWLVGVHAAVVAVVAQAVLAMIRSLCPDAPRATIATGVVIACLLATSPWMAVASLVPAALAGLLLPIAAASTPAQAPQRPSLGLSLACLGLLVALATGVLAALVWMPGPMSTLVASCSQAGALVFGGGHVVLPMLHEPLVGGGLIDERSFLAGYGAVQALPGPLFAIAAWIGAWIGGPVAALLAVFAIFAPGLLLALGCLRFYQGIMAAAWARRVVLGLNAGVVGVLGAALWHPIGTTAIHSPPTLVLAVAAFVALVAWKAPPWTVVGGCAVLAAIVHPI